MHFPDIPPMKVYPFGEWFLIIVRKDIDIMHVL